LEKNDDRTKRKIFFTFGKALKFFVINMPKAYSNSLIFKKKVRLKLVFLEGYLSIALLKFTKFSEKLENVQVPNRQQ